MPDRAPAEPDGAAADGRGQRRTDTRDPHRARARALKILFQADIRGVSPEVTLARLTDEPAAREILDAVDDLSSDSALLPPVVEGASEVELVSSERGGDAHSLRGASAEAARAGESGGALDGFTRNLVAGVHEDRARIDELISRFARRWQISRMPVVDRTVLRLATYELIHEDTSPAIVIDEAVGLAKALSTDDSGRYVNGVLESIRKELATNPLPRAIPADPIEADAEALLDLAEGRGEDEPPASAEPRDEAASDREALRNPGDGDPGGSSADPDADEPAAEPFEADTAAVPAETDPAADLTETDPAAPGAVDGPAAPGAVDGPAAPGAVDGPAERQPADQPSLFT